MPKPSRPPRQQIPIPGSKLSVVVCDDGSRTLRCESRNVTWHSESGALAESELVFLENSGVKQLIGDGKPARILEVGFGTGLNFLLSASAALVRDTTLEYHAFEPNPLPQAVLDHLGYQELEQCKRAFDAFVPFRDEICVENVSFRLLTQEVQRQSLTGLGCTFDAIFHDPFSPEAAPELWLETLFRDLRSVLKQGGRLVTYCVKSEIQRRLKNAGFSVSKTRGPVGGKREVLIATNESGVMN